MSLRSLCEWRGVALSGDRGGGGVVGGYKCLTISYSDIPSSKRGCSENHTFIVCSRPIAAPPLRLSFVRSKRAGFRGEI